MSEILVVDLENAGDSHVNFNSVILEIVLSGMAKSTTYVCLEQSQMAHPRILSLLEQPGVERMPNKISSSKNLIWKVYTYLRLWHFVKKARIENVIFLSSDNLFFPSTLLFYKLIGLQDVSVTVFVHNNIENIKRSSIKISLWKSVLSGNAMGVALAEFVKGKAKVILGRECRLCVLPHPIYDHVTDTKINPAIEKEVDFLILGRHSSDIGDEVYQKLNSVGLRLGRKIRIATRATREDDSLWPAIHRIVYHHPLGDKEYWTALAGARYLFFPPSSAKRLTASGVLADALTMGIPVLAPTRGVFREFLPDDCLRLLYDESSLETVFEVAHNMRDIEYDYLREKMVERSKKYCFNETSERFINIFKSEK